MAIKKFVVFSLVFHLVLFSGIYFLPEQKVNKAREFITNLISPEELKKPEIKVKPLPKLTPRPLPPPKMLPHRGPVTPAEKSIPRRPLPPRRPESLEKPVVPGEGKETGKPLPEGTLPKTGEERGKRGDGKTGEGGTRDKGKALEPAKPGFSGRDALFDRSIIEETARGNSGKNGGGRQAKKDDTITFDTEDYRYAGYMRNLRQKIESIWVYPPEAANRGIYGDLKIQFTIKKDGRLGAIELVRTSGHKMLDDAAMKALKDGEPYWPLPDSWGKDSYTILGHFVYVYGGFYIR